MERVHANTTFVPEQGQFVEISSYGGLLSQKGLYYAMWRQQPGERKSITV